MKRRIIFCLYISVILCLCACDKETGKENVDDNIQETTDKVEIETTTIEDETTIDEFSLLPDSEKIVKDINKFEKVTFEINTGSYKLETKEVTIEKATRDNKKYTVYCYATQENEEYRAENYYLLVYNYYDIGGWVLDECTVQEKNIVPQKACDKDLANKNLQSEFNLTQCNYEKVEKVSETEYVYYFKGIREHNYMVENYDLIVNCSFDKEYGWHLDNDCINRSEDWSKIYGTWYGEDEDSTNTVTIKNVDYINRLITLHVVVKNVWCNNGVLDVVAKYEPYTSYSEYPKYICIFDWKNYTDIIDEKVIFWFDEDKGFQIFCISGYTAHMSKID